jgi:hypothetical protein
MASPIDDERRQHRPSEKGKTSPLLEVSDSRSEGRPLRVSRFSAIGY